MIILILIIAVIAAIISWVAIKSPTARNTCGILALLVALGCTVAVTKNFTAHLGMKQVTTTQTKRIYSAGPRQSPAGMVLTKPLGTARHTYVLMYRDQPSSKAVPHDIPDTKHIVSAAKTSAGYRYTDTDTAKAVTKTTRWRSGTWRFWLNIGGQNGQLVKKQTTIELPKKTWIALTANQAKKVQTLQQKTKPADQAAMKQLIGAKTAAYQHAHPQASAAAIKAYAKKLTAAAAVQGIKRALN